MGAKMTILGLFHLGHIMRKQDSQEKTMLGKGEDSMKRERPTIRTADSIKKP